MNMYINMPKVTFKQIKLPDSDVRIQKYNEKMLKQKPFTDRHRSPACAPPLSEICPP